MNKKLNIFLIIIVLIQFLYILHISKGSKTNILTINSNLSWQEKVSQSCNKALLDNSTPMTYGPEVNRLAKELKVVEIAGYGPFDTNLYRELKNAPNRFCEKINEACAIGEDEILCDLGRKLYLTN